MDMLCIEILRWMCATGMCKLWNGYQAITESFTQGWEIKLVWTCYVLYQYANAPVCNVTR